MVQEAIFNQKQNKNIVINESIPLINDNFNHGWYYVTRINKLFENENNTIEFIVKRY